MAAGETTMGAEWVACVYRPHKGKEAELAALFRRHIAALNKHALVTASPHLLLRSPIDGSFLELFEWKSKAASSEAHQKADVMEIWDGFAACADMLKLADLAEANESFPHFEDASKLVHAAAAE
jgi:hypothetical protein